MKKDKVELKSFDEILQHLLNQPMARISASGKELTMRCPYCGDSQKSTTSTNFYINIDPKSDNFLCYKCFRASCNTSGIIDEDFLERTGFVKHDCIHDLNNFIKSKTSNSTKYKAYNKKEISNIIDTNSDISQKKLKYINNRMGLNLTYEDLYDLKINLNVNELLRVNGIVIPDKMKKRFDDLSNYGVSFISVYNDYLITRDISKSNKLGRRYINTNIFNNYDAVTKAYAIPTKLDVLSSEPTVLNITEGAFDILGVYYHLDIDRQYKNQLFVAASGSMSSVILHFMRNYGLLNLKINVFSDSDVSRDKYMGLTKLKPYLDKFDVTIYYNSKSKDYGVRKDEIKLIRSKLRVAR